MTTSTHTSPFILVDGSSYLFRAYHALPPLTTQQGEPTGAIYGMLNMLRKLLHDYQPEHIAVIFDSKGKTFRHALYPDYKGNRPTMADDLAVQIAPLQDIIRALGLPLILQSGVEADDIIGTLACQATRAGMQTLIVTGDKDMAQLVNEHVSLLNTMTNKRLDVAGVTEKFGVPPHLIIDYLTLVGDTVDNIPGVPMVGPKTAAKWLTTFASLDKLIAHADQISGKVGDNLRASLHQFSLTKQLTTICCDVPLDYQPEQLRMQAKDSATLITAYRRFECKAWLAELLNETAADASPPAEHPVQYSIVTDETTFIRWLERLANSTLFAFDTETTSLDYMQAELVGVSFAITAQEAAYVPVGHDYPQAPPQLAREFVLAKLKPLLENPALAKVGQNLKFDMSVLANYGITLQGIAFDTMLESYVLHSTTTRHDMDSLASTYLHYQTTTYEDIAGKGAKQRSCNAIDVAVVGPYAAEDADITLRLHQHLWPLLCQEKKLAAVFTTLELPLIPILSRMERTGVLLNTAMLQQHSQELAHKLAALEHAVYDLAGEAFNLASPKQLQEILFIKHGLPVLKKTPGGQASTAEDVLQELSFDYPIAKLLVEYRSLSKLKSTYTDRLPTQVHPKTGRVHTSYHQAITATGRLSSSEPNLQNIPIRTEQGRRIRQAFIAKPGYCLVAADYSQIELRIMAHLSQDAGLLAAFAQGLDIHRATAADVFDSTPAQVTPEQRRSAKAINFGLIYGMSAFGLAKQLGIDRMAAQHYVDLYFQRYPGVKHYMETTRATAHDQGFVETIMGRRLYLPEINARNVQRQKAAERTAINAPMQGSAADIIKQAMLACDAWLQRDPIGNMVMQVHDELVFEIETTQLTRALPIIKQLMEQSAELAVPLVVEIGHGNNWDEAH